MVRYWDLSTKEKASLTEDQVRAFCNVQLMEKGIVNLGPMPEITIPQMPTMQQEEWFEVCDLLVKTKEQAVAILAAMPHKSDYEYAISYDKKFAVPWEGSIKTVSRYKRDEVLALRPILIEIKEKTAEKEKREKDYEQAFKICREAVADIWEDYYSSQREELRMQEIRDTFDKYRDMCEGDTKIAMNFLLSTYTEEDVCNALPNDVPAE
jgi:hypothetical protein